MIVGLILNEFDSVMLGKACTFFKLALGLDRQDTPINIKLVDNLGRGKTHGTCSPRFDKDMNLKSVEIEIKQGVIFGMIEALAHEMVHAKQFINKDIDVKVETRFLLGIIPYHKVIRLWQGEDVSDLPYYSQPSELEAHLMQKNLTLEFLKTVEEDMKPNNMLELVKIGLLDS